MKEILGVVEQWFAAGHRAAIATVVEIEGSGPRELGAVMAVNEAGEVAGSVSGGCVEAAVVEEAMQVLADSKPRLLKYGIADELALSAGLTCGGTIHIFVESLERWQFSTEISTGTVFDAVYEALHSEKPFALCTMVVGEQLGAKMWVPCDPALPRVGSLGNPRLDRVAASDALGLLAQGLTQLRQYGSRGEIRLAEVGVFIQPFTSRPHLIIFGAIDFSRALCRLARLVGYRVTICDARSRFATATRFPEADTVVVDWPHRYLKDQEIDERTVIAVLTHDPKFDIPALVAAVQTSAAYIGAMGSRQAQADRIQRLKAAGLSEVDIARISAPTGLDIGARTPEETAISILAEVIALRSGRSGGRLTLSKNPIHPK